MDGDAVFDELRHVNPDINVVLSSGFAEQSKLGNMLAQGLRGFIPKPYIARKTARTGPLHSRRTEAGRALTAAGTQRPVAGKESALRLALI